MLVSHKHKCIFIHIPKTAGSSISDALYGIRERNLPQEYRCFDLYRHAKAREIRQAIGDMRWKEYYKFAFVRNPWDLIVSCYQWWQKKSFNWERYHKDLGRIRQMAGFSEFISSEYGTEKIIAYKGNMLDWVTDENGKCIVDFVGKFENLKEDFKKICGRIGIPEAGIPHRNTASYRHYSVYYTETTKRIIAERFKKEIELFHYSFEEPKRYDRIRYSVRKITVSVFETLGHEGSSRTKRFLNEKFPKPYRIAKNMKKRIFNSTRR